MPQYLQLSVTTDAGFDQSHSGPGQKPVGVIAGLVLSEGRGHSRATGRRLLADFHAAKYRVAKARIDRDCSA
ncbi:MAG: hypothetical protein QOJ56_1576 [Mycobacterium sp.]|nr:hypothetical protein [Mycobacterium sp.]